MLSFVGLNKSNISDVIFDTTRLDRVWNFNSQVRISHRDQERISSFVKRPYSYHFVYFGLPFCFNSSSRVCMCVSLALRRVCETGASSLREGQRGKKRSAISQVQKSSTVGRNFRVELSARLLSAGGPSSSCWARWCAPADTSDKSYDSLDPPHRKSADPYEPRSDTSTAPPLACWDSCPWKQ